MIEPRRSGHGNRAVARQVSTNKDGIRLTWILTMWDIGLDVRLRPGPWRRESSAPRRGMELEVTVQSSSIALGGDDRAELAYIDWAILRS